MDKKERYSHFENFITKAKQLAISPLKFAGPILVSVITWRIATAKIDIDLSNFDFSDLLAMILAFFAMGLSVAFYFKSTDSSNLFYDKIYDFTARTSEILGRIEERFGEQLKHLDHRLDLVPGLTPEIQEKVDKSKEKEEQELEKLKKTNEEYEKTINDLIEESHINSEEKENLRKKLSELTSEKEKIQSEIQELKEKRENLTNSDDYIIYYSTHEFEMAKSLISGNKPLQSLLSQKAPRVVLSDAIKNGAKIGPQSYIERLIELNILTDELNLTHYGHMLLQRAWKYLQQNVRN